MTEMWLLFWMLLGIALMLLGLYLKLREAVMIMNCLHEDLECGVEELESIADCLWEVAEEEDD